MSPDQADQNAAVTGRLRGILDWLREGYPAGVPPKDYIPLLALLRRRLSEDEVREIAREIARTAGADTADIAVHITKITDALPERPRTSHGSRPGSPASTAGPTAPDVPGSQPRRCQVGPPRARQWRQGRPVPDRRQARVESKVVRNEQVVTGVATLALLGTSVALTSGAEAAAPRPKESRTARR